MAKPKHGRSNSTPFSPYLHPPHPSPRPLLYERTRRQSLPVPPSSRRFPSPAVLSALAVIATIPPAVAGGPLPTPPPIFLCPSIERDYIDPYPHTLVTLSPRAGPSAPPTTTTSLTPQEVADKYVEGSDSRWRKTDAWTLYGSTCCSTSTTSTYSIYSQSSSYIPISTSTPSAVQFDTSVLPAGWGDATNTGSSTESTIILALAIVLAASICVFIIACVVWRRRKKKTRDIEHKLAHKLGTDDDSQDDVREKEARGKLRTWARASARWKSNIRQSARRRRKKNTAPSMVDRPPSPTSCDSPEGSAVTPSASSRRPSFVSESGPSRSNLCSNGNAIEPPIIPHDRPRSASPPTYRGSFVTGVSHLSHSSIVISPPLPDSVHAIQRNDLPPFMEDEPLPYISPSDGHIAIDDKAQLAHIRELASSPPIMVDGPSVSSMQSVSAPEWHEVEEDLEDMGIDLDKEPMAMSLHKFGFPPPFPPPPKVNVAFGCLDDHPLRYGEGDDNLVSFPVPAPSEPSLGAFPSAPPVEDDPDLEPSAPSLEGEEDLFEDWDGGLSYVPEPPAAADPNSTSICAMESFISPTVSSPSRASFPCMRESTTRDGILPRYRP